MRFQLYLALIVGIFSLNNCFAQCTFSDNPYGSGIAPSTSGTTVTISTCTFYSEYSSVTGFLSSNMYILDIDDGGYVTVFNTSGSPVAYGPAPLSFTPPSNGDYDIQWNGIGCTTDNNCHTTTVTNNGPSGPCTDPAVAGSVVASVQTACSGSPFTLSLSGASIGTGITYQWQSSSDGITYTAIVGATNATYSATQSTATYYNCIVTCSAGSPVTSAPLLVDMGNCVIMSNGSTTACSGNFYDSGGSGADYGINELFTFTITPSTPGAFLQIVFSEFLLEECCDDITVYNGNSTAAPLMGTFAENPGAITSSAADGSLTFVFDSDNSVNESGWQATIGCITSAPTNDIVCSPLVIPVDGSINYYTNGAATVETGENSIAPPATGLNETDGWGNSTLEHTVWFTFDAPASGSVAISCLDKVMDGQVAVYEVETCSDFSTFTFVGGNDNDVDFNISNPFAPNFTLCGLTPGQTYYLLYDSGNNYASGPFSISISDLSISAGTSAGVIDVCNGETVDLFDGITGYDEGGTWFETIPTFGLLGSVWNTAGVAFQVFDFQYVVENGCLSDTVISQVHVFGPSSAGNDGTINACKAETINLLSGLSGNVDLGGTWYNPQNVALNSSVVTTSSIPGQFNYDYIADNGVCPEDTANVLVIVSDCVAGIETISERSILVFPNPSKGNFYLNMEDLSGVELTLTDMNGRKVSFKETSVSEGIEIAMVNAVPGVYFLQVTQNDARYIKKLIIE
jgi:hypothetical protein